MLNVLDNQVDLDDEVPPAGLELYGSPNDQDADDNYYMGGVNNHDGCGLDVIFYFEIEIIES